MRKRQRIEGVTDITVYRNPVDHVLVPYDRVDTLQEASKTGPDHEQTSTRIPSYVHHSQKEWGNQVNSCTFTFKVPVEGNGT
jgi:hypothetical protein